MTQLDLVPCGRQGPVYPTYSISWLLRICSHKEAEWSLPHISLPHQSRGWGCAVCGQISWVPMMSRSVGCWWCQSYSQSGLVPRPLTCRWRLLHWATCRTTQNSHKQGKSEGFESCDRPIVRKRPIGFKIRDVMSRVTLKFDGWPWTRQIWEIW